MQATHASGLPFGVIVSRLALAWLPDPIDGPRKEQAQKCNQYDGAQEYNGDSLGVSMISIMVFSLMLLLLLLCLFLVLLLKMESIFLLILNNSLGSGRCLDLANKLPRA